MTGLEMMWAGAMKLVKSLGLNHCQAKESLAEVKQGKPLVIKTGTFDHTLYYRSDKRYEAIPN